MNKLFILFFIITISRCYPGFIFPIFDDQRHIWLDRGISPIIMEEGFEFGLTKYSLEYSKYEFKLKTASGHIDYHILSENNTFIVSNDIFIKGEFEGTGKPVSDIFVYGYGTVEVYQKDLNSNSFFLIGEFSVVPEPNSFFIITCGMLILIKKHKMEQK